jgi:hypothetical protein
MPHADDLSLRATNDAAEHAERMRHPCCGGPGPSNPVTLVTPTSALHRPILARSKQQLTGKGDDQ